MTAKKVTKVTKYKNHPNRHHTIIRVRKSRGHPGDCELWAAGHNGGDTKSSGDAGRTGGVGVRVVIWLSRTPPDRASQHPLPPKCADNIR